MFKHPSKLLLLLLALALVLPLLVLPAAASATLADGKNSPNPNLADGEVTPNLRDVNDNGMQYSEGTYSMRYSGNWLRSVTLVNHDLSNQDTILLNGTETPADSLTVYYDCNIRFSDAHPYRSFGMVLGRYTLPDTGEQVYVSVNIDPANSYLVFYFYKKVGGEADVNCEIALSSTFQSDTTYRLSAIKSEAGVTVYVNGMKLKGPYTTITGKDGGGNGYEIDLRQLVPVAGVHFMDIDATVSALTVKYLEEGVYASVPRGEEELAYAANFDSPNLFTLATPTLSANQRDPNPNGLTFDGMTAAMKYTGGWLRAVNYFKSDYLTSSTLLRDGTKIDTKDVDVYYKARYKVSSMDSSRTLGLIIGTTTVARQKVYVSCNVAPANGIVSFYFATDGPKDYTYEINCGFVTVPGEEYLLEIVRKAGRLHVYINGRQQADIDGYTVTAFGDDSLSADISIAELTPLFGVNFMDIDASMWDFEMKYLTDYDTVDYFVEPDYPNYHKEYQYHTDPIVTPVDDVPPVSVSNTVPVLMISVGSVFIVAAVALGATATVALLRRRKNEK